MTTPSRYDQTIRFHTDGPFRLNGAGCALTSGVGPLPSTSARSVRQLSGYSQRKMLISRITARDPQPKCGIGRVFPGRDAS